MPDNHGRQYEWSKDPADRLHELLETYAITVEEEKLTNREFATDLSSVWTQGSTIRPFLHCKLQLIEYLQKNDITVCENAIGVSKPMCFACNAYVAALNRAALLSGPVQPRWLLSGTSGKARTAWLIPPTPSASRVVSQIQLELQTRIATLVQEKFGSAGSSVVVGGRYLEDEEGTDRYC